MISMDFSGSNVKGGIGSIVHHPISRKKTTYTTYSPCRTWEVIFRPDPTFYGNQKQPLNDGAFPFLNEELFGTP